MPGSRLQMMEVVMGSLVVYEADWNMRPSLEIELSPHVTRN